MKCWHEAPVKPLNYETDVKPGGRYAVDGENLRDPFAGLGIGWILVFGAVGLGIIGWDELTSFRRRRK